MKLEIYYFDQCPFCQVVLRKMKALNLEEFISLKNIMTDLENRKYHQEKTGRTSVPCLYIDNEPMFESSDIMIWLEKNQEKIRN